MMDEYPFRGSSYTAAAKPPAPLTTMEFSKYSTIQGTQADIDRRLAAMGLAVKGGRDE